MQNGFVKVAAVTPLVRVADPAHNAAACIGLANSSAAEGVKLLVFPELCLTGATCLVGSTKAPGEPNTSNHSAEAAIKSGKTVLAH